MCFRKLLPDIHTVGIREIRRRISQRSEISDRCFAIVKKASEVDHTGELEDGLDKEKTEHEEHDKADLFAAAFDGIARAEPVSEQAIAGMPTENSTSPLIRKTTSEAMLLARFAVLAQPDAFRSPMPRITENAIVRNVPVPGPISPS